MTTSSRHVFDSEILLQSNDDKLRANTTDEYQFLGAGADVNGLSVGSTYARAAVHDIDSIEPKSRTSGMFDPPRPNFESRMKQFEQRELGGRKRGL